MLAIGGHCETPFLVVRKSRGSGCMHDGQHHRCAIIRNYGFHERYSMGAHGHPAVSGRVLTVGGDIGPCNCPCTATSTAELFDPLSGTFACTGTMTFRRSGHSATLFTERQSLNRGWD